MTISCGNVPEVRRLRQPVQQLGREMQYDLLHPSQAALDDASEPLVTCPSVLSHKRTAGMIVITTWRPSVGCGWRTTRPRSFEAEMAGQRLRLHPFPRGQVLRRRRSEPAQLTEYGGHRQPQVVGEEFLTEPMWQAPDAVAQLLRDSHGVRRRSSRSFPRRRLAKE
jgi:hypothetical protein